jgi:hypothetical protein
MFSENLEDHREIGLQKLMALVKLPTGPGSPHINLPEILKANTENRYGGIVDRDQDLGFAVHSLCSSLAKKENF